MGITFAHMGNIAKSLKQIRDARGLTLQQVADLTGVSVSQVQRIETGESKPLYETAKRLEEGLGERIDFSRHSEEAVA